MKASFILYVGDQVRARDFYSVVLGSPPRLDVPGMTEFELGDAVLGLMPITGIKRLLPGFHPGAGAAELYLLVDGPEEFHQRALAAGARELSPLLSRDWGHDAAYSLDLDGHVLAFAAVRG